MIHNPVGGAVGWKKIKQRTNSLSNNLTRSRKASGVQGMTRRQAMAEKKKVSFRPVKLREGRAGREKTCRPRPFGEKYASGRTGEKEFSHIPKQN